MKYNKLVRDGIPEYIQKKGGEPIFHVADDAEYWTKLKEKLGEEAAEFAKDDTAEELADLFEVLDAIIEYGGFDRKEIERLKEKKAGERGHFKKRIILDES